jgi:cell division protein FtsI/penicillin-binding protein 2
LRRRRRNELNDIPAKANRILHCVLVSLFLVFLRVFHLSVIEIDQKQEESRLPQRKTVIEPAVRATIRDRFNLPLAINRTHYQATILYSHVKDVPAFAWEINAQGVKIKIPKRKKYIRSLSEKLAEELQLDADRIEDLIHAKASFYSSVPFVIKEDLSEKEFYRLRMLENEWPGIHTRRLPRRHYPRGRTGADIIGYMGAINKKEYEKILHEIKALESLIKAYEEGEEVEWPPPMLTMAAAWKRLKDLQEKAYTIHDYIGKTGIEGVYEEQLRGFYGKKSFYSNSKGTIVQELPGSRPPLTGHRILLSLSSELQEFAEQLLAQNEEVRLVRRSALGPVKKTVIAEKQPWIKGGSITVMHPQTGEILALATFPRYDANDFILSGKPEVQKEKTKRIYRWFENDSYLGSIWNMQQPLEREKFNALTNQFYDEKKWLTWAAYLDMILSPQHPLKAVLSAHPTIGEAVKLQQAVADLERLFPGWNLPALFNALYPDDTPHQPLSKITDKQKLTSLMQENREVVEGLKKKMAFAFEPLSLNYDKILLVDLLHLAAPYEKFTPDLLQYVESITLADYKEQTASWIQFMQELKMESKQIFHSVDFKDWRKKEEKEFLRQVRLREKEAKIYPKPYIDYLDKEEREQFKEFWNNHYRQLVLSFLEEDDTTAAKITFPQKLRLNIPAYALLSYLETMRSYEDLKKPLYGTYKPFKKNQTEKDLAASFYPMYGFGYARSQCYRQSSIQGSLFKLVTAYAAMMQRYEKLKGGGLTIHDLNPLTMVDEVYQMGGLNYVGYTADGKPIPQHYKGGRLPRSLAHLNNGKVDIVRALEVSSNPYFSLLASEHLENPQDLAEAARLFSFGSKTGIELPGEIAGKVPDDLERNRTGLYAMAIGQHTLVVTPLQTAVMLASIANGGTILKPKIVHLTAGRQPARGEVEMHASSDFPFQETLGLVGIDFPLFSESSNPEKSVVKPVQTEVVREIYMPEIVRQVLLKGLKGCLLKTYQESMNSLTRLYKSYPEAIKDFKDMKDTLVGKTSTSESVENIDLDLNDGTGIYTHVWYGCIAFQKGNKTLHLFKDEFGQPELVVVVYLRYGGYGKEAAPIAAQIAKKWFDLKKKYEEG